MKGLILIAYLVTATTGYSFLEPVSCFQKANDLVFSYDHFYCCGEILLLAASITNSVLFGFLLYWHLRDKGFRNSHTYLKIKTWMMVLLSLFTFISVLRYTFRMTPALYAGILVVQQQCEVISYFLICWYFLSKGKKLIDES